MRHSNCMHRLITSVVVSIVMMGNLTLAQPTPDARALSAKVVASDWSNVKVYHIAYDLHTRVAMRVSDVIGKFTQMNEYLMPSPALVKTLKACVAEIENTQERRTFDVRWACVIQLESGKDGDSGEKVTIYMGRHGSDAVINDIPVNGVQKLRTMLEAKILWEGQ